MARSYLAAVALGALITAAAVQATSLPCGPFGGFYDPQNGDHCFGGQYPCGAAAGNCACPYTDNSNYDCFTTLAAGGSYSCPSPPPNNGNSKAGIIGVNTNNNRAVCSSTSSGDPLMESFSGCKWYLTGKAESVMNLISEQNHVVNTHLVPANLVDEHHQGDGTFHGAISVRYQEVIVTTEVDAQGNLTARLGNSPIPFGTIYEKQGLTVKLTQHYPFFGQVAEIVTPAFRFFIHAVQPYDSPSGWNRGHLDFSAAAIASSLDMHGLLGQGSSKFNDLCNDDFKFHGEGKEVDYVLPSLDSVDYKFNIFNGQKSSRRLHGHATSAIVYEPAAVPMKAGSAALM